MPIFQWTPKLDTGVEAMNEEHKVLLQTMNSLYRLNAERGKKENLLKMITQLRFLAQKHFFDEEEYLRKINYAEINLHKGIHRALLKKYDDSMNKFISSPEQLLSREFFDFLEVWIASHIEKVDTKYAEIGRDKKVAS